MVSPPPQKSAPCWTNAIKRSKLLRRSNTLSVAVMSEDHLSEKDEALSKLLKTWKPGAQLPPRFQEAVWRRIESAEPTRSHGLLQTLAIWIEKTLSRPALAASYVA